MNAESLSKTLCCIASCVVACSIITVVLPPRVSVRSASIKAGNTYDIADENDKIDFETTSSVVLWGVEMGKPVKLEGLELAEEKDLGSEYLNKMRFKYRPTDSSCPFNFLVLDVTPINHFVWGVSGKMNKNEFSSVVEGRTQWMKCKDYLMDVLGIENPMIEGKELYLSLMGSGKGSNLTLYWGRDLGLEFGIGNGNLTKLAIGEQLQIEDDVSLQQKFMDELRSFNSNNGKINRGKDCGAVERERRGGELRQTVVSKVTEMVEHFYVDFDKLLNIENGLLKDPKCFKEMALWQKLRDGKKSGNVIAFLNVADAIVYERDHVGDSFNVANIDHGTIRTSTRRRHSDSDNDDDTDYERRVRLVLHHLPRCISRLEIEAIDGELDALKKDKEGYEELFTKLGIANGSYHSGVFDLFGKARRDVGIATIYKRYISHAISEIVIPDEKSVVRKSKGVAMSKEEYFRTDSKVIATADQYKIVSNPNSSYHNPELAKRLKKRMNEAYNSYVAEVVNDKLNQESMNLYAEMHDAVISVIDKKVEKLTSESWKLRCN